MSDLNKAISSFATHASLVTLKMMALGPLTTYYRITYKVFENPEDVYPGKRLTFDHPVVSRVLRCNRNDLESIVPFAILGALYAYSSGASLSTIVWHYRVFVAARFFHSVAFLLPLPQPCRALAFTVGFLTNVSMAVQLLRNNWSM